jgi:hypothetical protein
MMEDTQFDADTGELFTTSEAAIAVSKSRMEAEEAEILGTGTARLMAALMAAVKKLPAWITTDKTGAHNITYATLKQILETVRPHLHEQGLRIRQGTVRSYELNDGPGSKGRLVIIYTDIVHAESGEVERTVVEIPLMKMDAQAMGSAITYGRRYSLLSALGLATDEADDDGESAASRSITERVQQTDELLALLKEISGFKLATDLAEWGHDTKQTKRLNRLSEAERALAHKAYADRSKELLDSMDEAPAPKKGAKA